MDFASTFPLQFYINLSRRDDRRRTLLRGFLNHGLDRVERISAVDGRRVSNSRGHRDSGRYALAVTQKLCLREARRRAASAVMLFEDDVVLHPDFAARISALQLPEDWGIFYLGVQHREEPVPAGTGVVKVRFGLDTHAIAVRAQYYKQVMAVLSPQGRHGKGSVAPSDWLLAALHKQIPTYAAFPNLAWQNNEAFSDLTAHRNAAYDERGFQRLYHEQTESALRRHLSVGQWKFPRAENSPSHSTNNVRAARKVAFLFLTRGLPAQTEMWGEYFASAPHRVSVVVHAKADTDKGPAWWINAARALPVETKWACVSLVRAHRHLLETAIKDPANEAFVLISESCVPIKPLASLLAHLDRTDWRGMLETETHEAVAKVNLEKGNRLHAVPDIPVCHWRSHPQWVLLNRKMTEAILSVDMTTQWEKSFAPDESLIGTQLSLMGFPWNEQSLPLSPTWTDWKDPAQGHPETFDNVDDELLCRLLVAPHFFARKFTPKSNIRKCGLHLECPAKVPIQLACEPCCDAN